MSDWHSQLTAPKPKETQAQELEKLIESLPADQRAKFQSVLGTSAKKEEPPQKQISEQERREQLIRECLDQSAAGNLKPLIEAVVAGKLDHDFMDPSGFTPLHMAVWRSDIDSVNRLLEKAACPYDLRSSNNQTPLMLATAKGNFELMKLFLDRGADIEAVDNLGLTPLLCAVQSGQVGAFFVLVHRGANMNVVDFNGCSAMHWSAYKNNVMFMRILRSYGMSLEVKDSIGMTPMHRASMSNAIDSIEYLMFEGANPELLDEKKRTPSQIAKEWNSEGTSLTIANFSKEGSFIHAHFTLLFMLFWVLVYGTYIWFILPYTAQSLLPSLIFNLSVICLPVLFLALKCSKPGFISKKGESVDNQLYKSFGEHFEQGNFREIPKFEEICYSCYMVRPQRSKHCRFCNICVPLYDHHCLFVGKCIGQDNHKKFVLGLSAHYLGLIFYTYLVWSYLDATIEADHYTTYFVKLVIALFDQRAIIVATVLLTVPVWWYSFWYLFLEMYSISHSLTANEVLNRHRYRYLFAPFQSIDGTLKLKFKNPFTKGIFGNWIEFLTK